MDLARAREAEIDRAAIMPEEMENFSECFITERRQKLRLFPKLARINSPGDYQH
ncbi:MAG: hypothetical protein CM15mP21_2340 [Hyphomicrobiales bacterium]|nr:MAG: hypothetical protein CM15mP21_2340 [Hyphomicrobiales bacterium]